MGYLFMICNFPAVWWHNHRTG